MLYLLPCIALVVAFAYMPISGWVLAFMDYLPGIALADTPFVGLKNFLLVFKDWGNVSRVMKNTIIYALLGYLVAPLPVLFG